MSPHAAARIVAAALIVVLVVACTTAPPASPEPDPGEGVVVTFRVAGSEEYRILLTDPADIDNARRLLAGEAVPNIPNGRVVRGDDGGVNTGYDWHIDPADIEFAEMTMEVCDGLPSYVTDEIITDERFCPWSAEVIAIDG
jgi:hypothetical protein